MKRLAPLSLLLLLAPACYGHALPPGFSFALEHPRVPQTAPAMDDLATALAAHGLDPALAPAAATVIEILISNNNKLADRLTTDESALTFQGAAIVKLQQQVAALLASNPPPAPAGVYTLSFGLSSDANGNVINGAALNGATVKGSIFIFTAPASAPANTMPTNVAKVDYFLDGALFHSEGVIPYNFNGDGNAWNTSTAIAGVYTGANGTHTVKQLVTLTNGTTETDTATFTVAN
jgi:hypothetical protein